MTTRQFLSILLNAGSSTSYCLCFLYVNLISLRPLRYFRQLRVRRARRLDGSGMGRFWDRHQDEQDLRPSEDAEGEPYGRSLR